VLNALDEAIVESGHWFAEILHETGGCRPKPQERQG
jgi:hypothetical protein